MNRARALLDVNVLLALFDESHLHHVASRSWLQRNIAHGWASCPITQAGFIRIISQPGYSRPIPIPTAIELLGSATRSTHHEFWPDDVSLLDGDLFDPQKIHGSRQLTDLYLLGLAVKHGGVLVTFDATIPLSPILHPSAAKHLVRI